MTERVWSFGRLAEVGPGPWDGEPDKIVWVDPDVDLDCMLLRNHQGSWCGYVAVPDQHPWFGLGYDDVDPYPEVHGGLTFADACHEGQGDDAICHTPLPGRPAHVWWLGFDCGHAWDFSPVAHHHLQKISNDDLPDRMADGQTYRTVDYARDQVKLLAVQAAAARVSA